MEKKFKYYVNKLDGNYKFFIYNVSTISNPQNNSIIFLKKENQELVESLKDVKESIIILKKGLNGENLRNNNLIIYSESPRYLYAKLLTSILEENKKETKTFFKDGYYYGENFQCKDNVIIEPFVMIGNNVSIEEGTIIKSGTKIGNNVSIGKNCYIRENSVIGGEGFGIEKDELGNNFRIPHIGGVVIKDNVEIGALTTVCSGTIEPTLVEEYAKIDDHVHVGHNTNIGKNSLLTAGVVVGGSTKLGYNCWAAPNTAIKNGLKIGNNVTLGMSARVLKDVEDNQILTNEKADTLENIKKFSKIREELLQEKR